MNDYDIELDAQGVPLDAPKGKAEVEKVRKRPPPPVKCRRWMHHRKGEYCKECGKVGT